MKNKQKWTSLLLIAGTLLIAAPASAHVTVWPKETTTGAYEKYSVRVPVEKESATTKVRVEFPQGMKVSTVEPMAGWTYAFDKDKDGNFTAITWTATQGGIKPHEFTEFALIGANPKTAGTLTWKAYQTYADGSTVEWTGDPSSKTPAPTITVKATPAADEHGTSSQDTNQATNTNQQAAATTPAPASTTSNTGPYILGGAAALLALISLFRKRAS